MDGVLTTTEREQLTGLEATIERGLTTFVQVGNALLAIRDKKLWRGGDYVDFHAYCQIRWGMSRRHADRHIEAASVAAEIETHVSQSGDSDQETAIPSPNLRQASEVAKAPPGQRVEVWKESVDTAPKDSAGQPKVTAKHVERVVARRRVDPSPDAAPVAPVDREGNPLPASNAIRQAFEAGDQFQGAMTAISQIKGMVESIPEVSTVYFDRQSFTAHLNNARSELTDARPHALCPHCAGTCREGSIQCRACHGCGWVKKRSWDQAPDDLKAKLGGGK